MPAASGLKGVYRRHKKWKAEARRPGDRRKHLGTYETKESAAEAVAAYMRGEEVGNRPRMAQSGCKGVYPSGKKFVAQGHRAGQGSHYLGTFEDLETAAAAVEAWERGEDAGLEPRIAASGIKGVYQSGKFVCCVCHFKILYTYIYIMSRMLRAVYTNLLYLCTCTQAPSGELRAAVLEKNNATWARS